MRQLILQTCIPHYRIPLFDLIADRVGAGFRVVAGDRYFDPTLKTTAQGKPWYLDCHNQFLAGDRFLWQGGLPRLNGVEHLVVEGNPRVFSTWLYLLRARRLGIHTAVWTHAFGRGQSRLRFQRKLIYMLADGIVCYSSEGARMLALEFPGKEIVVAGNSNLLARDCRSIDTPIEGRNCVLFLGRLVPEKRVDLLINALVLLQAQGKEIGARIIGDGPKKPALEELVHRHQLKDVVFLGYIKDQERIREAAACCFGLSCPGTAGLALTQAQSLGLPFIFCSEEENGPETEIANPGFNCLKFVRDNVESLAQAVATMNCDRQLWLSRSDAYSESVAASYTIEAMADTFANFFHHPRRQREN